MKTTLSFEDALNEIAEEIQSMQITVEKAEDRTLKEIGKHVSKNVEKLVRRSDVEEKAKKIQPKNYDGTRPYMHMKDDIKVTLKTAKTGMRYVKIAGGKKTGYKWRFLNDGTKNIRATHFVDNALHNSSEGIQAAIDNLARSICNE